MQQEHHDQIAENDVGKEQHVCAEHACSSRSRTEKDPSQCEDCLLCILGINLDDASAVQDDSVVAEVLADDVTARGDFGMPACLRPCSMARRTSHSWLSLSTSGGLVALWSEVACSTAAACERGCNISMATALVSPTHAS